MNNWLLVGQLFFIVLLFALLTVDLVVLNGALGVKVLVPPNTRTLILFFKSLIKRIKIDINMTKPQVLGELL